MKIRIILTDDKGKEYEGETDLIEVKSSSRGRRIMVKTTPRGKVPDKIVELIAKNVDDLRIPQLVLIALKFYGHLTKSQQKEILKCWGKTVGQNLESGNYKRDLIDKGLIHELGKSGTETAYKLTAKGKIEAEKILKQLGEGKLGKK